MNDADGSPDDVVDADEGLISRFWKESEAPGPGSPPHPDQERGTDEEAPVGDT